MEAMRSQLRMALSSSGFAKLHVVGNIKDALERMSGNRYDVILCDYALGDSTDGQQFLEYLRTSDLISRNTIFVMITAEQAYEKVMAASECAPDDYLLKPFTAAQFNARLEKLMEKQAYFAPIDKATDAKNWASAIAECDKKLSSRDKYFFELCKIKGSALMRDNCPQQAADLFRELLLLRPLGWAKLGLARALASLDQKDEAMMLAKDLIANTPQFMAVYDFLGKLLSSTGDKQAALEILQKARELSPGTMSRIRELSSLAVSSGKPEIAEAVMTQALQKNKYSPVIQVNDFAVLSKALVNQGKAVEAMVVVAEAKKSFKDEQSKIVLATSESMAYRAAGNITLAETALMKALSSQDLSKLSAQAVISLAEACFAMGKEKEAMEFLRHAIQNNQEDLIIKDKVHQALTGSGKGSLEASAMIEKITQEVIQLNNEGVRKAEAGQLEEASELLCKAANRLPNNLQIVGNAALVIALDLVRNGKIPQKLAKCLHYREALQKKSPNHPKLLQIDSLLKQLK